MGLPMIVKRVLSTRNRRACVVLLLVVVAWHWSEFLVVGHAEKWRVVAAWAIIAVAIGLASTVLVLGRRDGGRGRSCP
jgi:hypothetical protein